MTDVQGWRRRFGIVACAVIGVAAPAVALALPNGNTAHTGHTARPDERADPNTAQPATEQSATGQPAQRSGVQSVAVVSSEDDTHAQDSTPTPAPTPSPAPEPTSDCRTTEATRPPEADLPGEYGTVQDWAAHPTDGRWYAVSELGSLVRWDPEAKRYGSGYPDAVLPKGDYRDIVFDAAGDLYAIDAAEPTRAYQLDLRESTDSEPIPLSSVDWSRSLGVDGIADCAPAFDFGDAPGGYPTAAEAGGPSHPSDPGLTLGRTSSAEPAAALEPGDNGDDGDDALGSVSTIEPYATRYSVDVPYENRLDVPVTIAGWLDADLNGRFGDRERHVVRLEPGDPAPELSWPVPEIRPDGTAYLRLRLYEGHADDPSPAGAAAARGEVEDYPVDIVSAPVSDFYVETLGAAAGAGGSGTLPVVVGNAGPSDAELDVMVKVAPADHVSFGEPPTNCTSNLDGTVNCRLLAERLPADGDPIALQLPFAVDSAAPQNAALTGGGVEVDTTRDPETENNQAGLSIAASEASSDVSVDVTPAKRPVPPGKSAVLSVRATNAGPSDTAEAGTITLTTPAGSAPGSGLPKGCEVSDSDQVRCAVPAGLAADTSRTYDVPVRPDSAMRTVTKLTGGKVGLELNGDLDTSNNQATYGIRTAKPVADVAVSTSSDNKHRLAPGSVFGYRVRVTNHGPSDARGVELTDRLPAALTFEPIAEFPAELSDCELTGHEFSCPGTDLPAGESLEHTFPVRLSPAYAGDGSDLTDDADVFTWSPDPVQTNNTGNHNVPAVGVGPRRVDLRVGVTPPAHGVTPGTVDSMTMTAENVGPSMTAGHGRAVLRLPRSMSAPSRQLPAGCELNHPRTVVSCGIPEGLHPGTKLQWELMIEAAPDVPRVGQYPNGQAAVVDPADPREGNDRFGFDIRASDPAVDLVMAKRPANDRPVQPGGTFDYELTVINSGPSNARNVVIRDRLPRPLSYASSKQGCEPTGDRVVCPAIDELRAGESKTFVVEVELADSYRDDGREIANRAVVSSDIEDLDESNNSSEFRTSGLPGGVVTHPDADLSIRLESSAGVRPITPGETVEYRLIAANAGPETAVHTAITGFLPAPLTIVSSPDGCTATGQRLDCEPVDELEVGERVEHRIAVRLDPSYAGDGSDLAVWASVRSYSADPDRSDNSVAHYR